VSERGEQERGGAHERALSGREKRFLALLGMPTLALALSITTVTTYLPLVARQFTGSTTVIGVLIGAEGAVALVVPLVVGQWSDQLRTRLGGRLPFVVAGAPAVALSIALMGFAGSLILVAALALVFFVSYYAAYEPYRALYPDMLEAEVAGRGQSSQAVFRGCGTGLALVGGGLLFAIAPTLPFAVVGAVALATMAGFVWGMAGRDRRPSHEQHGQARDVRGTLHRIGELLRASPELRAFLVANALWELSLAALKTFVILYLTAGLGYRLETAVGIVGGVAVLILGAAVMSGKLGDRFGKARVATAGIWVYGLGLLVPFASQDPWVVLPAMPLIAFGGGTILTLPYALLIPLMPEDEHGILTGFYSFSRGLGILLGPLIAGGAISLLHGPLGSSQGYAAMWLVCSVAILASIPMMGPLRRRERARLRARAGGSSLVRQHPEMLDGDGDRRQERYGDDQPEHPEQLADGHDADRDDRRVQPHGARHHERRDQVAVDLVGQDEHREHGQGLAG
jgi:MFS family permease